MMVRVIRRRGDGCRASGLDRFGRVAEQLWYNTSTNSATDEFQYTYNRDSNVVTRTNLVNAAFSQPESAAVEPVPFLQRPDVLVLAKEGGKAVLFLVLTAIVVFGVLRPALKSIGTAPPPPEPMPTPAPALAAPAGGAPPSLEGVRQIAKSDPAAVANVVKTWVGDAKA